MNATDRQDSQQPRSELTVCDIIGAWGAYQSNLVMFALAYSAITSMTVAVGPIWTPDLEFVCASEDVEATHTTGDYYFNSHATRPHQCFTDDPRPNIITSSESPGNSSASLSGRNECASFIYNDDQYGKMWTNTFDLVCGRAWLRSLSSSSALAGLLLSSITLGLLSDRIGRAKCIKIGMTIGILATVGATVAHNCLLLNVCILLMSLGQINVANASCVLLMEATPGSWRFAALLAHRSGWALGLLLVPVLNSLTRNYQHFLAIMLCWQLVMLVCFRWTAFESIRWLLSEGKLGQAQEEIQRACHWNRRVQAERELVAGKIAALQRLQMRKASTILGAASAPQRLAKLTQTPVEEARQKLEILGSAIRRSLSLSPDDSLEPNSGVAFDDGASNNNPACPEQKSPTKLEMLARVAPKERSSFTAQGLVELSLKYSKALQDHEEGGSCFGLLARLFHPKLYKITVLAMLLSVVLEATRHGLAQSSKHVSFDVNANYFAGAASDLIAAGIYSLGLCFLPRRAALVAPTLLSALACLGVVLSYQLIPSQVQEQQRQFGSVENVLEANMAGLVDQVDSFALQGDTISGLDISASQPSSLPAQTIGMDAPELTLEAEQQLELFKLRQDINFWLANIGEVSLMVAIETRATIVMEAFPTNLRQGGWEFIMFIGRICSILALVLFGNDHPADKTGLKLALITIASASVVVCILTTIILRDTNKELKDRLNDIQDDANAS